ncbi:DDE superfamily endonuclease [Kitasatospora cineracea]|uniref:DDE superfamily endonuclease n=1 Tax=Kitasatospora cineracea TaxID=88074 RepID=A0A8G1UEL3_9ACTN|nr:DDE superfamily endonuclease [Kitasatospora cineracea]
MRTDEDQPTAVGDSVDLAQWQHVFEGLMGRVAGRFSRVGPRRRARAFVLGLLADLPRKNCWTIAEHAGDTSPAGMQHLLSRASWDADQVRDDLRDFVVDNLGDENPVLVVDETGDLKKGIATVGVQRQYTGTAGRIENSQVAVYLVYATSAGHAAIDPEGFPRTPAPVPEALRRLMRLVTAQQGDRLRDDATALLTARHPADLVGWRPHRGGRGIADALPGKPRGTTERTAPP